MIINIIQNQHTGGIAQLDWTEEQWDALYRALPGWVGDGLKELDDSAGLSWVDESET